VGWHPNDVLNARYCLRRRLGGHGHRQTWLAADLQSNEPVTIKALLFASDAQLWQDLRLLEREAETLASISHPAVPKLYERFEYTAPEGCYTCLVLEYIPGESLFQLVQRDGPFDVSRVRELADEILTILQALHALAPPVIHRDLKPENLIVREEDGRICLVDFGSVRATGAERRTLTVVGTFGYMAPEQFSGEAGIAADLYGLGATVLFALSGQPPAEWPLCSGRLDLDALVVSDPDLRVWLRTMLQPDPTVRFADAARAREALFRPDQPPETLVLTCSWDSRMQITQSLDRRQVKLRLMKSLSALPSLVRVTIEFAMLGGGLSLLVNYPSNLVLMSFGVTFMAAGIMYLCGTWRFLPWEWQLVSDAGRRRMLRTLFGGVVERYELPAALSVATMENSLTERLNPGVVMMLGDLGKRIPPTQHTVALASADGTRYWLGNWYTESEARQLESLLKEWLEEST